MLLTVFLLGLTSSPDGVLRFHHTCVMLLAILAYSFGRAGAVDADHIAVIDTVTRKPMQQGKTPLGVAFFSLGHSTTLSFWHVFAIVVSSMALHRIDKFCIGYGSLIGTAVSAFFAGDGPCLTVYFVQRLLATRGESVRCTDERYPAADDAYTSAYVSFNTSSWHILSFSFGL